MRGEHERSGRRSSLGRRAVSSTIATVLLVAIVVTLSAGVGVMVGPLASEPAAPSQLALSVERTTIGGPGDGWVEPCAGLDNAELAVEVTITQYVRADEVYVIVADEGGEDTKTIWSDPGQDDVGQPKLLANEVTGSTTGVDVDLGGGGDVKLCPDEDVTFRFYAETDDQTLPIRTYTLGSE